MWMQSTDLSIARGGTMTGPLPRHTPRRASPVTPGLVCCPGHAKPRPATPRHATSPPNPGPPPSPPGSSLVRKGCKVQEWRRPLHDIPQGTRCRVRVVISVMNHRCEWVGHPVLPSAQCVPRSVAPLSSSAALAARCSLSLTQPYLFAPRRAPCPGPRPTLIVNSNRQAQSNLAIRVGQKGTKK